MVRLFAAALLVLFAFAGTAAETDSAAPRTGPSGLPVPRFVSLAADKVNFRTGPGVRHPVAWVFERKGLPVLVTAEFDYWRKVRDQDGAEGWVHKSLLSGRRSALIVGQERALRREPRAEAPVVLRAEAGVVGRLLACADAWCKLEIAETTGWLPRQHIFGALVGERFG
jgi:SH3-like domain-containing protein